MRCKRSALALMNNTAIVSLYISRPLLSLSPPPLSLPLAISLAHGCARTRRATGREGGSQGGRAGGRRTGQRVLGKIHSTNPRDHISSYPHMSQTTRISGAYVNSTCRHFLHVIACVTAHVTGTRTCHNSWPATSLEHQGLRSCLSLLPVSLASLHLATHTVSPRLSQSHEQARVSARSRWTCTVLSTKRKKSNPLTPCASFRLLGCALLRRLTALPRTFCRRGREGASAARTAHARHTPAQDTVRGARTCYQCGVPARVPYYAFPAISAQWISTLQTSTPGHMQKHNSSNTSRLNPLRTRRARRPRVLHFNSARMRMMAVLVPLILRR